jgi:hypothetical protein
MKALLCRILGHRYYAARHFSPTHRIVGCLRCKKLWGMHDEARAFVPWDDDLTQLFKDGPFYDPMTGGTE